MQGITTVSCRGLLICSVVFSSSVLANPAIDYKREEIEWCMINRESWQPCDACFFSLSPFSVGLFLLLFSWRRVVVHTGRPHRDSMDPRNALWKHRGKKHSYCALLANQKTSPTKISRNPLPPILLRPSRYFGWEAASPLELRYIRWIYLTNADW